MSFPGVLGAASLFTGAAPLVAGASAFSSVFSGIFGGNDKDNLRIQNAKDALTRALAGDQSAVLLMQQGAGLIPGFGSATAVGKAAFLAAYNAYLAQQPTFVTPVTQPSVLQQQVATTTAQVRDDIAAGLQNLGAGATNVVSGAVGSSDFHPVTIPSNQNQIIILAAIAGVILLLRK